MEAQLNRVPWSADAARVLADAARGALSDYERQVKAGASQLWLVSKGGVGYVLTRFECLGNWRELVIVAAAGRGFHSVVPQLIALARRLKLDGIRTHVQRPGLVRMYRRYGFAPVSGVNEIILRWIHGRQF